MVSIATTNLIDVVVVDASDSSPLFVVCSAANAAEESESEGSGVVFEARGAESELLITVTVGALTVHGTAD